MTNTSGSAIARNSAIWIGATNEYIGRITGLAAEATIEELHAATTLKGGIMASGRIQDIIKAEIHKRDRNVIWAVYPTTLVTGNIGGDPTYYVENTSTGESKRIKWTKQGSKFAAETVTGFEVEFIGSTGGRDLFRAV